MISKPNHTELHKSVILFDGVCNLCNSSVNFVIDRDKASRFKFSALQSPEALPYITQANRSAEDLGDLLQSILLIEGDKIYDKSTAALKIARHLDGLWPLLFGLIIIPRFVRDFVYDWIAQNRYQWFGQLEACRLPTPELRSRFLDGLQGPG